MWRSETKHCRLFGEFDWSGVWARNLKWLHVAREIEKLHVHLENSGNYSLTYQFSRCRLLVVSL